MATSQPNPYGTQPASPVPPSKSAMAIVGLIMGVVALAMSWVPILNNLAFIFALLGVVFAIIGLVGISRGKKSGKGLAIAALVVSIIAGVVVLGTQSMYSDALDAATGEPTEQTQDATSNGSEAAAESEPVDEVPTEYENALAKAQVYSDTMYMSKKGIYDQLTSDYGEQFSEEAADYAMEHIDADWKANALAKAKTYEEEMNMSPDAIHDQLTSDYGEQFTEDEADYAIEHL